MWCVAVADVVGNRTIRRASARFLLPGKTLADQADSNPDVRGQHGQARQYTPKHSACRVCPAKRHQAEQHTPTSKNVMGKATMPTLMIGPLPIIRVGMYEIVLSSVAKSEMPTAVELSFLPPTKKSSAECWRRASTSRRRTKRLQPSPASSVPHEACGHLSGRGDKVTG